VKGTGGGGGAGHKGREWWWRLTVGWPVWAAVVVAAAGASAVALAEGRDDWFDFVDYAAL